MKYIFKICIILVFSLILISCKCNLDPANGLDTSKYLENKEVFNSDGFKYKIINIENEKFIAYKSANGYWEITQIINTKELCKNNGNVYESNKNY
jgi:hypothetical protein